MSTNNIEEALVNANESLENAWNNIESLINVADKHNTYEDSYKEAYWEKIRTLLTDVTLELSKVENDLKEAKLID